ncbi:hypothetical protein Y032_0491g2400 [Ancylostoma ceylanicum]|uniref:Uncharacterized protein n=1 Tax=Ancylostoma ceylanicum TaxID=53326 RepID=A0A016WWX9_9BILA|nr:hypothetical protein Y032_0491g2400 [Ancylostoma ceylanicum]
MKSINRYSRPKWLSYSYPARWRSLADTPLPVLGLKWKKIDEVNKSLPSPKMVVIFVLSALENPRRHVLAYPPTKMEKIHEVNKSIIWCKMVVIFMFSVLTNPSRHVFATLWANTSSVYFKPG